MSEIKDPSEEFEPAADRPQEAAEAPPAASEAPVAATENSAAPAAAAPETLEQPEGANLLRLLIEAQKEAVHYKEGLQRERAAFANYKKRAERERGESYQRATHDTLKSLLPIIDDFGRAFENVPANFSDEPWLGGMAMIQRKFLNLLEQCKVEALDPTGQIFDPEQHQAIVAEASDSVESGHVIETLQKGYRVGAHLLRPALVRVAQ